MMISGPPRSDRTSKSAFWVKTGSEWVSAVDAIQRSFTLMRLPFSRSFCRRRAQCSATSPSTLSTVADETVSIVRSRDDRVSASVAACTPAKSSPSVTALTNCSSGRASNRTTRFVSSPMNTLVSSRPRVGITGWDPSHPSFRRALHVRSIPRSGRRADAST